jgi:hypothetical protein
MSDYGHLARHRLPGGTYTLPEYVCWLWSDAAQLPAIYRAHPSLVYLVALHGIGVTVQDIFDLMDATADSGVVFGEFQADYHQPLRPGVTYECDAEILDVERKSGRRAGVFDKLSFQVTIREKESEEHVAVCTNVWVFPRRNGHG